MAFYECNGLTQADLDNAYQEGYSNGLLRRPLDRGIAMQDTNSPICSEIFYFNGISTIKVPISYHGNTGWGSGTRYTQVIDVTDMAGNVLKSTTVNSTSNSSYQDILVEIDVSDLSGFGMVKYAIGSHSVFLGSGSDGENKGGWVSVASRFGGSPAIAIPKELEDLTPTLSGDSAAVSVESSSSTNYGYKVFDKNYLTSWISNNSSSTKEEITSWIQYKFDNSVNVKKIYMKNQVEFVTTKCIVEACNNGAFSDSEIKRLENINAVGVLLINLEEVEEKYMYYRITLTQKYAGILETAQLYPRIQELEFYGYR